MRNQRKHRQPRTRWLKTRRGAIVVFAAFMMIVFLATVAFSVDVAYMQLSKVQLRTATDSAARAAGESLSREQCLDCARQAAKDIAEVNLVAGDPLLLDDSDVVFGNSAEQAGGAWAFTPGGEPINAVRVFGRRTREAPSGSVATFFGRVFDVFDFEPTQAATVVRLDRDICLVVDRSSSMKLYLTDTSPTMSTSDPRFCQKPDMTQSRWGALKVAVDRFVNALATTPQLEHVGLVSYGSAYTACSVTNSASSINCQLSQNHANVTSAMATISNTKFNGATNIEAGILKGIEALTNTTYARPYAAKTMVLMSDGHYTVGQQPSLVAPLAVPHDILIHTISFGEADQEEMAAIAAATGGNHYYAPNATALQEIFEEIALTLPVIFTD
jgi:hypothetical protein